MESKLPVGYSTLNLGGVQGSRGVDSTLLRGLGDDRDVE